MSTFLLIILFLAIAIAGFLVIQRWPDYAFWVIILLLFDPSGHLSEYFGKESLGGFYYRDFLFALAFLPLFSTQVSKRGLFSYKPFLIVLGVQLLFLLYHIFVFGYLQPGKGWGYVFRYVIVRERMSVLGFLLMIPVFVMACRNLRVFVDVLVWSSLVIYFMYFFTILTNVELMPVWQAERYQGSGIMRYLMYSSGLTDMLIPLAFFVFVRNVIYRYSKVLYVSVTLIVIATLLSLTKSSYINVAGLVVACLFLYYRFYRASVSGLLGMLIGPGLLMLLLMFLAFPDYPQLVWRQIEDLWLFMAGSSYTGGQVEGRLLNQWPAHLALISQRPFFGTGAGFSEFFSLKFRPSDYEVTDLPITGHLAMYGVVGLIIYSLLYFQMWRYIMSGYKMLKDKLSHINELDVAFFFVVFAWMVKTFFFKPNYLFNELTTGTLLINLYAGILLAILFRHKTAFGK
ncbi:MAG TPA: hypothetical protein VJ946_10135 [Bacteroidales bacterium]|nr:hypothetical protein [Bacteroidales bacterium]